MGIPALLQDGIFVLVVFLLVKPVGIYLKRVFAHERTFLDSVLEPVERLIYRLTGIASEREMSARHYAVAFVLFSLAGTLALYALLRVQRFLPWFDPVHMTTSMTPDLAMNTAISFATTTTWQVYAGGNDHELPESTHWPGRAELSGWGCWPGGWNRLKRFWRSRVFINRDDASRARMRRRKRFREEALSRFGIACR